MSEVYQPEGCRDLTTMLDAIATALDIPDGQRGVAYYLTEAKEWIERGGCGFAVYALRDAARQDDCTPKQWSKIMIALKACKRASYVGA